VVSARRALRVISGLEGLSLLVLLFVAMPLKYGLGLALAVRVAGGVHGVLFLAFCAALFRVVLEEDWPLRRWASALGLALVPFGALVLDRRLR
jgi:integral membrane protein